MAREGFISTAYKRASERAHASSTNLLVPIHAEPATFSAIHEQQAFATPKKQTCKIQHSKIQKGGVFIRYLQTRTSEVGVTRLYYAKGKKTKRELSESYAGNQY